MASGPKKTLGEAPDRERNWAKRRMWPEDTWGDAEASND